MATLSQPCISAATARTVAIQVIVIVLQPRPGTRPEGSPRSTDGLLVGCMQEMLEDPAMVAPRAERRLAAILAADVVGYSRLMERDEAGTLERAQGAPRGARSTR